MLRNLLRETIFMRICIVFCLGIITYEYTFSLIPFYVLLCVITGLIALLGLYRYYINAYNFTFSKLNGSIVFTCIFMFAYLFSYFQDVRNNINYLKIQNNTQFIIKINNAGKKKKNKNIYEANILNQSNSVGKILLTIKSKELPYNLHDKLSVKGNLLAIESIKHPGEFNYKNYLINKRIHHQLIVDSAEVKLLEHSQIVSILNISYSIRNKLLAILRGNIKDEDSYEMAAALLLGERADIDQEIMKSYTDTGTIHIISVSGLHVGIIFLVLQYIFKIIPFVKNEIIKTISIILLIWLYACLTGLPASVIRSALMISFLSIGKAINIKSNPINHIAASALLILCINTNYLFDIGFQLSYLAVIGIVYLQKPISNLYVPKYKFDKYIWLTFSVSIAGQLFTLPFCMYYFHQFPNYFLLANLLAIPLSSIALYAAIANLVFASIPYLNTLCEWTVTYSIQYLNKYLGIIASLPGAVLKFSAWSFIDCFVLSLVIFFLILLMHEKIKKSLKYVLLVLICYSLHEIYNYNKHNHAHVWKFNSPYTVNYTIETKDSLLIFLPLNRNDYLEKRMIQNWNTINIKKRCIRIIKYKSYYLEINKQRFSSMKELNTYEPVAYERICM